MEEALVPMNRDQWHKANTEAEGDACITTT